MSGRRTIAAIAIALLLVGSASCGGSKEDASTAAVLEDDTVTVGSFNFAESELLAEIYSQALEHAGFDVRREFGLGPRELVSPALASGLVELVPEYAGTALQFLSLGAETPSADTAVTHTALLTAAARRGLVALDPAPAQNVNEFVVTQALAQRLGLHNLSDLTDAAPTLTFGGPPECPTRPLCLAGLGRMYGLSFDTVLSLDAGGPMTQEALTEGYVDVALMFSTDPAIAREGLVELVDDRFLQPAENVTPMAHADTLRHFGPGLSAVIDAVSRALTTQDLRDLNAAVEAGASTADAASGWLAAQGLR